MSSTSEQSAANGGDDLIPSGSSSDAAATILRKRSKKAAILGQITPPVNPSRKSKRLERASSTLADPGEGTSCMAHGGPLSELPVDTIKEAMLQAFADPDFKKILFQGAPSTVLTTKLL